jgi:hypothetical protein
MTGNMVGDSGLEDSEESSPSKARFNDANVMVVKIISIAGGDNPNIRSAGLAEDVRVCLSTVK